MPPPEPGNFLLVSVRSYRLHRSNPTLSTLLCAVSFTIVPAVEEQSFALDLTIRDEQGFLLVEDSLKWRMIRRFGIGVYGGNAIKDWLTREEPDQFGSDGTRDVSVGRKTAGAEMSNDLYRQLTQLVYNARMRRSVLSEVGPADPWGRP